MVNEYFFELDGKDEGYEAVAENSSIHGYVRCGYDYIAKHIVSIDWHNDNDSYYFYVDSCWR